jgi:hypothetical protein
MELSALSVTHLPKEHEHKCTTGAAALVTGRKRVRVDEDELKDGNEARKSNSQSDCNDNEREMAVLKADVASLVPQLVRSMEACPATDGRHEHLKDGDKPNLQNIK